MERNEKYLDKRGDLIEAGGIAIGRPEGVIAGSGAQPVLEWKQVDPGILMPEQVRKSRLNIADHHGYNGYGKIKKKFRLKFVNCFVFVLLNFFQRLTWSYDVTETREFRRRVLAKTKADFRRSRQSDAGNSTEFCIVYALRINNLCHCNGLY